MIAYVRGELISIEQDGIIVECGGIGYHIFVPGSVLEDLPSVGSEVRVHTHFQVREDAMQLYGFLTKDDLQTFRLLLGVNGIGPKGALGVLSVMTPDDLRFAVLSGDAKAISKAPGIGAKTAQKVILELKDKVDLEEAFEQKSAKAAGRRAAEGGSANDAVQALVALGYSSSEAMRAVRSIENAADMDTESLLKIALKNLF